MSRPCRMTKVGRTGEGLWSHRRSGAELERFERVIARHRGAAIEVRHRAKPQNAMHRAATELQARAAALANGDGPRVEHGDPIEARGVSRLFRPATSGAARSC